MSSQNDPAASPVDVTPSVLREWPLPTPEGSKYSRGQVVVVGGSTRTPGAIMLSAIAALRMGAGRLGVAVDETIAAGLAIAMPECGVIPLPLSDAAPLAAAASELASADAVLLGPGLDDAELTERMLRDLPALVSADAVVILDAFALGVASRVPALAETLGGRLVLTPNLGEASRLLERVAEGDILADEAADAALQISRRYNAVVSCTGTVTAPDGRSWRIGTGAVGLGTSGSGDVLAGAIAGLAARGADPSRAAVWGTHAHAAAGDRLAVAVGPLGYLASELLPELPRVLVEIGV